MWTYTFKKKFLFFYFLFLIYKGKGWDTVLPNRKYINPVNKEQITKENPRVERSRFIKEGIERIHYKRKSQDSKSTKIKPTIYYELKDEVPEKGIVDEVDLTLERKKRKRNENSKYRHEDYDTGYSTYGTRHHGKAHIYSRQDKNSSTDDKSWGEDTNDMIVPSQLKKPKLSKYKLKKQMMLQSKDNTVKLVNIQGNNVDIPKFICKGMYSFLPSVSVPVVKDFFF